MYDFMDAIHDKKQPHLFPSQKALADYTMQTRKIFPKKKVKEGGPARALLAHIF
jgi:hypothetical protein